MTGRMLRLSADELAYTLAQSGRPDIGQGILQNASDFELSAEDVMQRMLAAGHSLLARELLQIDAEAKPVLTDNLQWLAHVLTNTPFSLRYTLATTEASFSLNYHAINGSVVEHSIEQGVIHVISEHDQPRVAVDGGVGFFKIAGLQNAFGSQGEIMKSLLDEAQQESDVTMIRKLLERAPLTSQMREQLAADLAQTKYRGSVLRVEYGPQGEPTADRGLLLLHGPERLWILKPSQRPSGVSVTVIPGSEAVFRREVAALMK